MEWFTQNQMLLNKTCFWEKLNDKTSRRLCLTRCAIFRIPLLQHFCFQKYVKYVGLRTRHDRVRYALSVVSWVRSQFIHFHHNSKGCDLHFVLSKNRKEQAIICEFSKTSENNLIITKHIAQKVISRNDRIKTLKLVNKCLLSGTVSRFKFAKWRAFSH